jgi:hypothetical protein
MAAWTVTADSMAAAAVAHALAGEGPHSRPVVVVAGQRQGRHRLNPVGIDAPLVEAESAAFAQRAQVFFFVVVVPSLSLFAAAATTGFHPQERPAPQHRTRVLGRAYGVGARRRHGLR